MARDGAAKRILGAFTEAIEAAGADRKLVNVLNRVRTEIIPDLEQLVRDTDRAIDHATSVKDKLRTMRTEITDAEIEETD